MQPTPSPLSTPAPPPLHSHWQRIALPVQLLALILTIMLLGSVRCERKSETTPPRTTPDSRVSARDSELHLR